MTSDQLILGTNKGLLIFEQHKGKWELTCDVHQAIPVSYAAVDPRNGTLWACLDHGHWGCKLHRPKDGGATWQEVAAPAYPEGAERKPGGPGHGYLYLDNCAGWGRPTAAFVCGGGAGRVVSQRRRRRQFPIGRVAVESPLA